MTKIQTKIKDNEGNEAEITLESLKQEIDNMKYIKVKNGEEKTLPVAQVLSEIWEATEWLRDIKVIVNTLNKHPKLFKFIKWLLLTVGGLSLLKWGIDYRMWLLELLK